MRDLQSPAHPCNIQWYGPTEIIRKSARAGFPQCLADVPVLLPTRHAALRARLDRWFEAQGIRPRIVGEFEDSALMAVLAARGLGVFPLAELGAEDLSLLRGLRWLGRADGVIEEIHAIRSRRGRDIMGSLLRWWPARTENCARRATEGRDGWRPASGWVPTRSTWRRAG